MTAIKTLDDRIADAFESDMTAIDLALLLKEVETADKAAKSDREKAEGIALNPKTRSDAVADARKTMDDATFRSNRLATARTNLTDLHTETVKKEAEAARQKHVGEVLARRDALVEEVKTRYPDLVWAIADLLDRITRSNDECLRINSPGAGALVNPKHPSTFNDPVQVTGCRLVDINRQTDCWIWADGLRGPGFDPVRATKARTVLSA